MKTYKYDTEEAWLEARRGKITGTRLGGLLSKRNKAPLKGFYEVIAERVAIPHDGENVLDRGKRLEDEAIERFSTVTGKKVDTSLMLWCREDDENVALSPDGKVEGEEAAVEVKCLNSAAHIQAFVEQSIPDDYHHQMLQYFIVNEKLETLYFIFYDPRMTKDFFYLTITRESVQLEVDEYLALEREALEKMAEIEQKLTF